MISFRRITLAVGLVMFVGCEDRSAEPSPVKEAELKSSAGGAPLNIADIKAMPNGFDVAHSPRNVEATETDNPERPYRWEHKETVTPQVENLTVQEFGYIVVINGEPRLHSFAWDGKPYDRADFAKFFDCKDGPLTKGRNYSRTDWTENETLEKSEMTSYFVGVDEAGKHYSGYSTMTKLPQMKTDGEQGGAEQPATAAESNSE